MIATMTAIIVYLQLEASIIITNQSIVSTRALHCNCTYRLNIYRSRKTEPQINGLLGIYPRADGTILLSKTEDITEMTVLNFIVSSYSDEQ